MELIGTVTIGGTKTKDSFARSHALRTNLGRVPAARGPQRLECSRSNARALATTRREQRTESHPQVQGQERPQRVILGSKTGTDCSRERSDTPACPHQLPRRPVVAAPALGNRLPSCLRTDATPPQMRTVATSARARAERPHRERTDMQSKNATPRTERRTWTRERATTFQLGDTHHLEH